MGRPGSQPQYYQPSTIPGTDQSSSTSINHFSHPHPLQLSLQPQRGLNSNSCAGCKDMAPGLVYSCTICNYFLHQKCSEMPQQITHPFDKDHVFDLLPRPCYAEGFFNCDACGKQGQGFCYHCKICFTDLHILCAALPMNINHQSHHHQLKLIFSPHYPEKIFSCDICYNAGSCHWLYNCDMCEFDAHLDCATNVTVKIHQNMHPRQTTSDLDRMQKLSIGSTSTPQQFRPNLHSGFSSYRYMQMVGAPVCAPSWQRPNNDNLIVNCSTEHGLSQQIISYVTSGGGEAIRADVFGGLQGLCQGLSVSNGGQNTSPPSGGCGDGSGQHNLQNLMGASGTGNIYGLDIFGGLSMLDGVDMRGLLGGLLGVIARRITRRITRRISRRITRRITRRRTRRVTRRIIRRITRGITRKITSIM